MYCIITLLYVGSISFILMHSNILIHNWRGNLNSSRLTRISRVVAGCSVFRLTTPLSTFSLNHFLSFSFSLCSGKYPFSTLLSSEGDDLGLVKLLGSSYSNVSVGDIPWTRLSKFHLILYHHLDLPSKALWDS